MILHQSEIERLRYVLRGMRHLYEQMVAGYVKDYKRAADGMLAPYIRRLEEFVTQAEDV